MVCLPRSPRLRGHRDQITCIKFLSDSSRTPSSSTSENLTYLVTASKDTFVKVWDLSTQHCVQTQVAHRSEVWSIEVEERNDKFLVLTGSGDGEVKAWTLDGSKLQQGISQNNGEVSEHCIFHHIFWFISLSYLNPCNQWDHYRSQLSIELPKFPAILAFHTSLFNRTIDP